MMPNSVTSLRRYLRANPFLICVKHHHSRLQTPCRAVVKGSELGFERPLGIFWLPIEGSAFEFHGAGFTVRPRPVIDPACRNEYHYATEEEVRHLEALRIFGDYDFPCGGEVEDADNWVINGDLWERIVHFKPGTGHASKDKFHILFRPGSALTAEVGL